MNRLPKTISEKDFAKLVDGTGDSPTGKRNRAMLWVMWDCGLRVGDVLGLSKRDIDWGRKTLKVRRGKGGVDRNNLPLTSSVRDALKSWEAVRPKSRYFFCTLKGGQLSDRYIRAMVARLSDYVGVHKLDDDNRERPINPHMLRHSYATRLLEGGANLVEVQRALGHANLQTTSIYLHVNDPRMRDTILSALGDGGEADDPTSAAIRRIVREELSRD